MIQSPYGRWAVLLPALGAIALLLHLVVPHSIVWSDGPDLGDAQRTTNSRSDMVEHWEASGSAWPAAAAPRLVLVGTALVLGAGLALLVPSLLRMGVGAARFVGAAGGTVGVAGATLAAIASFHDWGWQVAALLSYGNGAAVQFALILSPLAVGALACAAFVGSLAVLTSIVPAGDGMRERAQAHHRVAKAALVFAAVAISMPWSLHDPEAGAAGAAYDYAWLSAYSVEAIHSTGGGFDSLSYALGVFVVGAWTITAASVVAGLAGLLSRVPGADGLRRLLEGLSFVNAFLLLWLAVLTILCVGFWWSPTGTSTDHQPGYPAALALAGLAWLGWTMLPVVRPMLPKASAPALQPAHFD
ncbi:MAG TPA: hypothetical protein VFH47_07545 [Candidatus Thermoplasmatota archaeon]|nr:hypothetical protein [Candidatus Thermoplasmatota archaeon]